MDRTERGAATPVLRSFERHASTWQRNARGSWNARDVWLTGVPPPREIAEHLAAGLNSLQCSDRTTE